MAEQDEQQKLQGYLRSQGAKLSAEQIRDRIQEASDEFLGVVQGATEALVRKAPAPGEWSLAEILDHLVTTEERITGVINGLVAGRKPPAPLEIGATSGIASQPWPELLVRLSRSQAALSALLTANRHEPHVDLRFPEGYFGDINWKEYALILRLHYKDHAGQARNTLEALGGTGATK
ncbi:MAG: DinB family protein [candidate division NC10 bacterium]